MTVSGALTRFKSLRFHQHRPPPPLWFLSGTWKSDGIIVALHLRIVKKMYWHFPGRAPFGNDSYFCLFFRGGGRSEGFFKIMVVGDKIRAGERQVDDFNGQFWNNMRPVIRVVWILWRVLLTYKDHDINAYQQGEGGIVRIFLTRNDAPSIGNLLHVGGGVRNTVCSYMYDNITTWTTAIIMIW